MPEQFLLGSDITACSFENNRFEVTRAVLKLFFFQLRQNERHVHVNYKEGYVCLFSVFVILALPVFEMNN